jgi:predicted secreted protein
MAQLDGNTYRFQVESTTPGTYNEVAGQQGMDLNGSAGTTDVSTKSSGAYALKRSNKRDVVVSLEGLADLPDANGFTRLETLMNANPQVPFNVRIVKLPSTVVFAASVYGGSFSKGFPQDGNVSYSATFTLAAAPTTDALS